jgi:diketogulonate reductase-like aldo/keto reductase
MKGSLEHAFVAGEVIARTGRHLVVLTLPLVCWLAAQEYPAQALLAWAVRRGTASFTALRTAYRATAKFDISRLPAAALEETD